MRFQCQSGCTACCRQRGFVYLTEEDIPRIAGFLGMTPAAFEGRYVYRTRHLRRLRIPRNSTCHFLKEGGCAIHPAKPVQCRIFPFWPELVEDRREWRTTAEWCPGIGKGGPLKSEFIRFSAAEMKREFPELYE
ncbi:MAG: YkgJ family cysteine cluster protein [Bryobacterales bacterium]|nr:YkgJ family cysteine cluster protein [Bryobacterales bacterium]